MEVKKEGEMKGERKGRLTKDGRDSKIKVRGYRTTEKERMYGKVS